MLLWSLQRLVSGPEIIIRQIIEHVGARDLEDDRGCFVERDHPHFRQPHNGVDGFRRCHDGDDGAIKLNPTSGVGES